MTSVRMTDLLLFVLLPASSVILVVNILAKSPIIGIIATITFLGIASFVLGDRLFRLENRVFRFALALLTLLMLLSLVGAGLIIIGQFTELSSLLTLLAVYLILIAIPRKRDNVSASKPENTASPQPEKAGTSTKAITNYALAVPFIASAVTGFFLLLSARTGEGGASVWLAIPQIFAAVYLTCAFSLFVLVFFSRISDNVKLASICIFSLLSHSLFLIVWYPGRYGDPWSHLGQIRYILRTGEPYAYSWIVQNALWVDLLKFRAFHSLVAFLGRMLYIDVYWIYIQLIPVLWSIFTPLLAYRIAETLETRKSKIFPQLAAIVTLVFSSLISWGAVSVPNSLGFLFFYFSVLLLLLWIKHGGKLMWFVAASAVAATSLFHPQPGVFALMFLLFVTIIHKIHRRSVWVVSLLGMSLLYPIALQLQGSRFALEGLVQMSSFLSLQSEISTILLVFAVVGLILGIRGRYVWSKAVLLLFSFYTIILLEYYVTKYGMINLPYGPTRILAMADFLLVPLVALGFWTLTAILRRSVNTASSNLHSLSRRAHLKADPRLIGLILVALFLSLQATSVLYQAYPMNEIVKVQPSAYELEAIYFIDQTSPERYVVLCEPGFSSLAVGFLGADYGYLGGKRGLFGIPEWGYPTAKLYLEMTKNPSIGILQEAIEFASADLGYFVISVRNPNFNQITERARDIFPGYETFGNDQLYVFWYPLPIYEKEGSQVTVIFDDGIGGQQNVTTRFSYMTESETNATLTLSGHASYLVQNFPQHWAFRELRINGKVSQFDDASNINSFVYVSGLQPSDQMTLRWVFNAHYTAVGWKEDSFKGRVWRQGPYVSNATPTITTDGNILTISHSFVSGTYQYYYYSTTVDLSTNDYPYILMRWRSDQPVAVSAVYFETGISQEVVPLGSASTEWSSIVVGLPSNAFVRNVMVGFNNARSQGLSETAEIQIDYILFSAKSTP